MIKNKLIKVKIKSLLPIYGIIQHFFAEVHTFFKNLKKYLHFFSKSVIIIVLLIKQ